MKGRPLSTDPARFEGQQQYLAEKQNGTRRPNGVKPLKKLSGKHLEVITLHLAGATQTEIAQAMRVSQPWVSQILSDPLAREAVGKKLGEMDQELRALGPTVLGVLRDCLRSEDKGLALQAADKWFKSQGYYDRKVGGGHATAEDIVAELMKQTQDGQTTSLTIAVSKSDPTLPPHMEPPHFPCIEGELE